ncbi:MAG: hypothetical protein ACPHYG_02130 [Flavobacteriales bacterium]
MGDQQAAKNAQAGVEGQLRVINVRRALLTDLKRALTFYNDEEPAVGRAQRALVFKGQRTAPRDGVRGLCRRGRALSPTARALLTPRPAPRSSAPPAGRPEEPGTVYAPIHEPGFANSIRETSNSEIGQIVKDLRKVNDKRYSAISTARRSSNQGKTKYHFGAERKPWHTKADFFVCMELTLLILTWLALIADRTDDVLAALTAFGISPEHLPLGVLPKLYPYEGMLRFAVLKMPEFNWHVFEPFQYYLDGGKSMTVLPLGCVHLKADLDFDFKIVGQKGVARMLSVFFVTLDDFAKISRKSGKWSKDMFISPKRFAKLGIFYCQIPIKKSDCRMNTHYVPGDRVKFVHKPEDGGSIEITSRGDYTTKVTISSVPGPQPVYCGQGMSEFVGKTWFYADGKQVVHWKPAPPTAFQSWMLSPPWGFNHITGEKVLPTEIEWIGRGSNFDRLSCFLPKEPPSGNNLVGEGYLVRFDGLPTFANSSRMLTYLATGPGQVEYYSIVCLDSEMRPSATFWVPLSELDGPATVVNGPDMEDAIARDIQKLNELCGDKFPSILGEFLSQPSLATFRVLWNAVRQSQSLQFQARLRCFSGNILLRAGCSRRVTLIRRPTVRFISGDNDDDDASGKRIAIVDKVGRIHSVGIRCNEMIPLMDK